MTRRNVAKAGSLFLSWATAKRDGGDRCVVTILRGEAKELEGKCSEGMGESVRKGERGQEGRKEGR